MKDLVILVADKNAQFAIQGVLSRPAALGVRQFSFDFRTHPGRDGGVRTSGVEVPQRERTRFEHGLLMFDLEGSGVEGSVTASTLESDLDARLSVAWGASAKAVVVAPEIDAWIWGADHPLRDELKWPHHGNVRRWLAERGFEIAANGKPHRPKEALEALMSELRRPRSAALYERVTRRISLRRCTDPAFTRLRSILRHWFAS